MGAAGAAVGLGAAGLGLNIFGMASANEAQSKAEQANADYYNEQSEFARKAMLRDLSIYKDQAAEQMGGQITGYAAGGVNLEGSPMLELASTKARQISEEAAIKAGGQAKIREAYLRAGASQANADRLGGFGATFLPALGSALGFAGQTAGYFSGGSDNNGGGNYRSSYVNSATASSHYGGR